MSDTFAGDQFWYCLRHSAVEGFEGCPAIDRLGPYASHSEASNALETLAQRNEAWDNDPDWNEDAVAD